VGKTLPFSHFGNVGNCGVLNEIGHVLPGFFSDRGVKSRQLLPKIRYVVDTLVKAADDGLLD